MRRFFYHTRHGGRVYRDRDGTELESVERARHEAIVTLSEMAREEFPRDGDHQELGVEVYDEDGKCILNAEITFDVKRPVPQRRDRAERASEDR